MHAKHIEVKDVNSSDQKKPLIERSNRFDLYLLLDSVVSFTTSHCSIWHLNILCSNTSNFLSFVYSMENGWSIVFPHQPKTYNIIRHTIVYAKKKNNTIKTLAFYPSPKPSCILPSAARIYNTKHVHLFVTFAVGETKHLIVRYTTQYGRSPQTENTSRVL